VSRIKRCGVYFILNVATGKHYVGSSVDIDFRWSCHISSLRGDRSNAHKLARAWKKYGEESFVFGILEEGSCADLPEIERKWICRLNAVEGGYNILAMPGRPTEPRSGSAGSVGRLHTAETRAKMSASHKRRTKSPEHLAKIAAALRGRVCSPEVRARLREAAQNRSPEVFERLTAANRRIGEAKRGLRRPPEVGAKVSEGLRAYHARRKAAAAQ
jgi:group I intron endonuclease